MGVSGCGKSTTGKMLAQRHDWPFLEGDDFHPPANISKMTSGVALTDRDRVDWMDAIAKGVRASRDDVIVLACSALTPFVRYALDDMGRDVLYIHLKTDNVDMGARFAAREHFMPPELLDSQYAALSLPVDVYEFDAAQSLDTLVDAIALSVQSVMQKRKHFTA